ncbi:MAG TPA: hypothetical protein VHQ22_10900 [Terriglobales bacterium]|jgi:hypothetical protein|nr:hypothetical protein [Terriglobales bacterium]
MSTRQKSSLAQLLAKQPAAGSTFEQAKATDKPENTPFFDRVIAGASGTESFEAVLTKITGPVDPAMIPTFPTAQCLTPEQVYAIEGIGQDQQAHLTTCPWCRNMVAAAQPNNDEFEEIRRKAKAAANAQRRREIAAC